jgi:RNA polymerase sigma factor (sigma-70 family)
MDLTSLYQTYSADVFRFALYLSGNRAEAEDITAETFVRVWTSSEPVRVATVKGYLFTVARNLFLQQRRRESRRADLDNNLPDPGADAHWAAERRAEWEAVVAGLSALREMDRAALLMSALDGTPYDEISRVLGISLSAVKSKIHRARLALMGFRRGEVQARGNQ